MEKLIAILYSHEQNCFHVETLLDYCKNNVRASVLKEKPEYRLIAVCQERRKVDDTIAAFTKVFKL